MFFRKFPNDGINAHRARGEPRFPLPPEGDFYGWMLRQFELPAATPLTRGFFESQRVQILSEHWIYTNQNDSKKKIKELIEQQHNFNRQWRAQLHRAMAEGRVLREQPALWRRHPISVVGRETFGAKIYDTREQAPSRAVICAQLAGHYASLAGAELLVRRDIEVMGRARVARIGPGFYLQLLDDAASISATEKIETAIQWRDLGLFEPRDAEFCARFPQIMADHARWLADRRHGERAVVCGRDLREVSWPKGALRGADLRGAILRDVDLSGDDLRGCDLRWADLTAARLVDCRLARADLHEALLDFALIPGFEAPWKWAEARSWIGVIDHGKGVRANPLYTRALRPDLSYCDLRGRVFSHIIRAGRFDFSGSDLRGADFSRSDFSLPNPPYSRCSRFDGADLRGANVWGANFNGCKFEGADLSDLLHADRAQWDDAPPANRDWRGTKWRDGKLRDRNFCGCDFSDADLRGADLSGADFTNSNLRGADLRGASLSGTRLQGADLAGARVSKKALGAANLE